MKIVKVAKLAPTTPVVKAPRVEPFFERMKEFQDRVMRHAYELFTPYPLTTGLESWFAPESEYLPIPLEVEETEEGFLVRAELPGFKEKEIEVRAEPGRIFIGGKREETTEEKKGKTVYSERSYAHIARWFELPVEIDPDRVKATLTEGLLEITLHKAHVAKLIRVEAKAA